ncbi:MAG: hypothetical protein E6J02_08960 [Chloroflexi bacterium]|nr:MAG: hypothetical protein E6J02_08960 [Chloroflexota bacterium]TME17415.1 MAG: hypothetical protein E6I70_10640 [Chloroflexota bacterium]TME17905.1 MAG: hypothetical protein E6I63_02295 [Chloroflexota bacterium]
MLRSLSGLAVLLAVGWILPTLPMFEAPSAAAVGLTGSVANRPYEVALFSPPTVVMKVGDLIFGVSTSDSIRVVELGGGPEARSAAVVINQGGSADVDVALHAVTDTPLMTELAPIRILSAFDPATG